MHEKNKERIYNMAFSDLYPLYIKKAEKKGRTKEEVDVIISWLTGYTDKQLKEQLASGASVKDFFTKATIPPQAEKITGMICGYRVEEIEEKLTRHIRYLDKLIDELAKGKKMEKILRG